MKSIKLIAAAVLGAALAVPVIQQCSSSPKETYYEKVVEFPADATLEEKVEMASRLVPTPNQLAWQELGLTAFLHFGVNTFTDREWGDGTEDPAIFNPDSLDAEQWVKTLKDAGFKLVILTAKHHDGFCLWPTKTTDHSVASSPWKDGKGDVVAELRKACDKYGMKMGIYLSPWDRNSPKYGDSPAYNDQFVEQLTELLTNYGKIDEVWFDGACAEGPNGKKQEYDWVRFRNVMETLQPEAVLAITGDDVRWVGNEGGKGRETEWSATVLMPSIFPECKANNDSIGVDAMHNDLGSRDMIAKASRMFWWPSEVDVSIRPGWFYHKSEQPKSLAQLADIYLTSVGRNSVLLLNIPPDNHGLIPAEDVARLKEFRKWIDDNFSNNLATRSTSSDLTYAVKPGSEVNCILVQEDISKGQRVEDFTVEAFSEGQWAPVAKGTTIGYKRILKFPSVNADSMRLTIDSSRGVPNISNFEAHHIIMPDDIVATETEYNVVKLPIKAEGDALQMEAPSMLDIAGFIYTPSKDNRESVIFKYAVEVSTDGTSWTKVPVTGEFSNIFNNPIPQRVVFSKPVKARYFRLVSKDDTGLKQTPDKDVLVLLTVK